MASDIHLGIELDDEGSGKKVETTIEGIKAQLKGVNKEAKELRGILKSLEKEKGILNNQGNKSNPMAQTLLAQQTGVLAKQRGAAEVTGAAARDFAHQAQGLGGLVRLYATFAANIFALGAAFRALSNSMDTSNMVKGLDQLGAASGRNLGGLSKRLVELTDGAVSMAEAMKVVALTSSGGMSQKNIERLAQVAKSASIALGVAMPDAISRLSRGITKLEPELLDELGIMTRIDPAVELYARQVGKAVSQLTIFERRQAFANAVLAEGEEKFGAIAGIAVNPYDRLLSSLKDVMQTGTAFINNVLSPIAEWLSSSPTALTLAVSALAGMVLKQAIPALGELRDGLAATAKEADQIAINRGKDAAAALNSINDRIETAKSRLKTISEEGEVNRFLGGAELRDLRGKDLAEESKLLKVLEKNTEDVTKAELKRLDVLSNRLINRGLDDQANIIHGIKSAIEEEKRALEDYNKVAKERQKLNASGNLTAFGATQKLAIEAQNTATKKLIISNAAYNGSILGLAASWRILKTEIADSDLVLNRWQRSMLLAKGGMAIIGGTITTITNAISKLGNLISIFSILAVTFAAIEAIFSNNAKEAAAFSSALDTAESAVENATRTMVKMRKDGTQGSIIGIKALSEAFLGLADAIEASITTANKKLEANTGFDRFVNNFLGIFGKDIDSKLANSLVSQIESALDTAAESGIKSQIEDKFRELFNIEVLDTQSISEALNRMSKVSQARLILGVKEISTSLGSSAANVDNFRTALDNTTLAYQQFIQTTSNPSPVFRFGASLENIAVSMREIATAAELSSDGINAVILELMKDPTSGALLGDTFINGLIDIREEYTKQEKAIVSYQNKIKELDDLFRGGKVSANELARNSSLFSKEDLENEAKNISTLEKVLKDRKALESRVASLRATQDVNARTLFSNAVEESFRKGAELIRISLGQAMEKGALVISRASLAGLTGEDRARAEAEISRREIEIRLREIDTNIQLILTQEKLIAALEHSTAVNDLALAHDRGASAKEISILEQTKESSRIFSELLSKGIPPSIDNIRKFSDNEDINNRVNIRGIPVNQKLAEAREAKILAEADMKAAGIAGSIAASMGRVEDIQKLLALQGQLLQSTTNRLSALRQITGLNSEALVIAQGESDTNALILRQRSEMLAIDNAIAVAQSDSERRKQEEFKRVVEAKQEVERTVTQLQISNMLIASRLDLLSRTVEVARTLNNEQLNNSSRSLELRTAEVAAYSQLFNIIGEYSATQNEILGNERAQLDFIRTTRDVTIEFIEKYESITQRIAALDPVRDAGEISNLTSELERQETMSKSRIRDAKSQLTTQQAILKITKDTTNQQTRYNRLLSNANKITTNLSSSFGSLGSAIGNLSESFTQLVVTSSQGAGAIAKIRKEQEGLVEGTDAYKEKDKEIAIQLNQNKMDQLSGYGQIAGAAKHMFDEQSAGYQALLTIERIFHLAHIGMALARMAMDATATTASVANTGVRIGEAATEASANGVLAVVKAIASLPFPADLAAGALVAGVVGALLSSIGGKSPKSVSAKGGFSSEDVQSTQGTGSSFIDGKLSDRSGGILGNSKEQAKDFISALQLIENNTSNSSLFGIKTVNVLQKIEENTKNLAGAVLGSTNIGRLTSGFGTVEKVAAPKASGLLSMFIPSSSKSVEIVDKGIEVIGEFNDLLAQTAQFLEFETVKITKQKSGFLGIGAKTKISFQTNTKELGTEASEVIINLFTDLANSAVQASKLVFGQANTSIQDLLETFVVNFKVSGFGMSSSEFAEAILSESNVIINQILEQSLPELDKFRKSGEGFAGTLLRLATTVEVMGQQFRMFGSDISNIVDQNSVLDFTVALSDVFGGLDKFTESTNFIFENFLSTEEQLLLKTEEVNRTLRLLGEEGTITADQVSTLTDGVGDLRIEYRNLLASQDLTTEAGREAFHTLSMLAPAIVEISDDIEDSITSLKDLKDEFKSSIGSLIKDASLGNLDTEAIGDDVATAIREGFLNALSNRFVDDITNSIVEQLITPVLTGALEMTATSGFILTTSVNTIVDDMISRANLLGEIIKNPSFRQALSILSTSITSVVSTINENAKKMTFAFSKLKAAELLEEINDLSREIEERRLDDIIEAEEKRFELLREQADELEDTVTKFRDFSNSLRDFKQELLTGPLTPLTPLEQLDVAKKEFVRLFEVASSSNVSEEDRLDALDKIQSSATTFLEASRLVFSSGPQFTENFNFVQSVLDSLITTTGVKATIDEMQLDALKSQILLSETLIEAAKAQKDLLSNIDNTLEAMLEKLDKLKKDLDDEYQVGTTQIADGFSVLDRNFDGLLSFEELKASGMASDDTLRLLLNRVDADGDTQINRLEAIKGAAEGTQFTVQSTIPILDAINMGIITVAQGLAQLKGMNTANIAAGGSNFTGTVNPPTSGGVGIVDGKFTQTGAFIAADKVVGLNNLSTSVEDAKSAIMAMAAQIDRGMRPAMDLYNLFKSWGASSGTVGSLLGVSGADVLSWLRMRDTSIPAFKDGINKVPFDMLAMIHEGERVFPKADNDSLMSNIRESTNTNKEILVELQKMREELKRLQAVIAEGDDLNIAATNENAASISNTLVEVQSLKNHIGSIEKRLVRT